MIATSIEQSKKLLELGLDPESADMYYTSIKETTGLDQYILEVRNIIEDFKEGKIPAWSIGCLFDMVMRYDSFEEIEIGHITSEEVIDSLLELIEELLEDDEKWQENYKIEK